MPTSKTWNNTSYSIPNAGEVNWSALTTFLTALATSAQTTSRQLVGYRTATATPVTVNATSDAIIATNLTIAGAVTVNLPNLGASGSGNMIAVADAKGDAATNNVTINATGGATINGSASYVIGQNNGSVILIYDGTSNWVAVSVAGTANKEVFSVRTATATPVTVSATDATVLTNLAAPGAVTINLPAGTAGRILQIADAKGDAATNNITITPNGVQTIDGAASYILNTNSGGAILVFDGTANWKIIARYVSSYVAPTISGVALYAAGAEARFQNAGATHYAGIKAAAGTSADVSYTLPTADGTSGYSLQTNGSAALSWSNSFTSPAIATATITGVNLFSAGAEARFQNAGATHYAGIKAAAGTSADRTYTLPTADGSAGNLLQTDGSGSLSWVSSAAASDQGTVTSNTSTAGQTIASGKTLTYPNLIIPTGQTYTDNGTIFSPISFTVQSGGILIVNSGAKFVCR